MSGIILSTLYDDEKNRRDTIRRIETENIEPTQEEQEAAERIISELARIYSDDFAKLGIDDDGVKEKATQKVADLVLAMNTSLETKERVKKIVMITAFGYGPLTPLIEDDTVTEILVLSYNRIRVERHGIIEDTGIRFTSEDHLQKIIQRIAQAANRQPNISHPLIDAELRDGSRVQITYPPVVENAQMNIRKFRKDMMGYPAYIATGAITPRMMLVMKHFVIGRLNIFISGGTGTGKTTFLNVLSNFIPKKEIIVTIEDTYELQLQQPNVMRMRTRETASKEMDNIDQAALLRAALRKRPDRIIQGEARGPEIFDLINAMSTGHEGSLATVHANSPQHMCSMRIPNMFRMNGEMRFETSDIQALIADSVEIIIQLKRYSDGRRRVSQLSYVNGLDEKGEVIVTDMFRYLPKEDRFVCTGCVPEKLLEKMSDNGVEMDRKLLAADI